MGYLSSVVGTGCWSLVGIGLGLRIIALYLHVYTPLMAVLWKKMTALFPNTTSWMLAKYTAISAAFVAFSNSSFVRAWTSGKLFSERIVRSMKRWIRFFYTQPIGSYPSHLSRWIKGQPYQDATTSREPHAEW